MDICLDPMGIFIAVILSPLFIGYGAYLGYQATSKLVAFLKALAVSFLYPFLYTATSHRTGIGLPFDWFSHACWVYIGVAIPTLIGVCFGIISRLEHELKRCRAARDHLAASQESEVQSQP